MTIPAKRLTVRWTLGDVSDLGFEALRLSTWGIWNLLGERARYVVCVNSLPLERARAASGALPQGIEWKEVTGELPEWMRRELFDPGLAEGVGWKFAPPRLDPDGWELSLDNDVILWDLPAGLLAWLRDDDPRCCCLAEDLRPVFGRFAELCGDEPRNLGIRGLPPDLDLEAAIREVHSESPGTLSSETDEQGLQVALLTRRPHHVVSTEDVTICSPWSRHQQHLGRCGAHFVGLNAKSFPEEWGGREARRRHEEHWAGYRETLYERVGLAPAAVTSASG